MMKRITLLRPVYILGTAMCISLFLFTVAIMYTSGIIPFMDFIIKDTTKLHMVHNSTPVPLPENTSSLDESLRYIPHSTIQKWKERDYLIVLGIPSLDIDERRTARKMQRTTCWQFPGVARRANNFTGAMLVLYVLARQPFLSYRYSESLLKEVAEYHDIITLSMNEGVPSPFLSYRYSESLLKEVAEYHDIITLSMNEGVPSANRTVGSNKSWGMDVSVALCRKVFYWFEIALRVFPNTNYIAKGDDDMFLLVPQYLADLYILPQRRLYWGFLGKDIIKNGSEWSWYRRAWGPLYTLAKDVAIHLVSHMPLRRLINIPYEKDREAEFLSLNMENEDTMVGRVLYESLKFAGYKENVFFVSEGPCTFRDIGSHSRPFNLSFTFVMLHHLWEADYIELMNLFGNITKARPRRRRRIHGRLHGRLHLGCR
ncbi:UDP-Gal or UDP-GlcNAc-dependent glycosyltransferase [Trypanosoma theileri]|uniref:Hexosyltransferase n=1 Tax=Trypanosoma theileri TaxID=67003 RepID=A0A1X0NJA3_9TRYP|nr:UDP-Gal or UDP-GlcNAc-dependent glycosyltransferase [Trypanosoma theileri]ORC84766.1 UDP-Gal or UDP-GlcNAc-dependent glycosyltransferase [Trypanosoma theileri]